MTKNYDIFISYKRKSLPTANNLYYRLTKRGYSTFFDLEDMGRDNFNIQLHNYIENAKDIFVVLEEGSLDACKTDYWKNDWFCHEIAFALEKGKNIIPILINGYQMPPVDFFPDELKELRHLINMHDKLAKYEQTDNILHNIGKSIINVENRCKMI